MLTYRLIPALALLCLVSACKNPERCTGNPNDDCRLMWDAPGPKTCKADLDCMAPTGVCDLGATMTCVACTTSEPGACQGATPVCVSNECQKCTAHAQCTTSNVCLPDGTCADPGQVAYVASGGSGTTCTKASPCGTLDDGVRAGRPFVKIATGTVADTKTTSIDGKAITILADPGAKLSRANPGVILQVQNDNADVEIFDLEITGATGPTNPAISIPGGGLPKLGLTRVTVDGNQGIGILATAGRLIMSRSVVSTNTGGGISILGAEFNITNTMIVTNGGPSTALGGLRIDGITVAGSYTLDFNTVAANIGPATINTGVTCGTVLVPLAFSDNIIYANIVSGGGLQIGGNANCTTTYSDIGPDAAQGTGNINLDPMFAGPMQGNFHLKGTSPAKDVADPGATLAEDIDGDVRPQGPRRDMGADEIKL